MNQQSQIFCPPMLDEPMRPIVNLNGSARAHLIEDRVSALDALRLLQERLGVMVPNGRDYPGQPDTYRRDCTVHFARLHAVRQIDQALEAEAVALDAGR